MNASLQFCYQNPQPADISMELVKDLHKVNRERIDDDEMHDDEVDRERVH